MIEAATKSDARKRAERILAERFERQLNEMASRAYQNREIDERWREVASCLDHVRTLLRGMIKP